MSERVAIVVGADVNLGLVTADKLAAARFTVARVDVNVGPALWLTQAAVPYPRDRGAGSIVHVAAHPGLEPAAGMPAYGA